MTELSRRGFLKASGTVALGGALAATGLFSDQSTAVAQSAAQGNTVSSGAGSPLSLPKGGGAIKGIGETFQANPFSGTGNFAVPVATSPGRAGFGPQLSLQYSSGNGNGPFGLGWQLSIPRIARKTEKGLPTYTDKDVFVMSGAEDLVPCLKEIDDPENPGHKTWVPEDAVERGPFDAFRYRPRTEGLFARIEKWVHKDTGDVHWRATTKGNVASIYGRTPEARIADPRNPGHVFEWLLQETYDAEGNHILYEYAADDPALDLDKIYEENRTYCQRYIRRIYYGNLPAPLVDENGVEITYDDANATQIGHRRSGTSHKDPTTLVDRHYAFEVLFDYEDWDHLPFADIDQRKPADRVLATELPKERSDSSQEEFGLPEGGAGVTAAPVRPDPFSSFRAGFELRTLRRCRRVLMFHHFRELGGPTLIRSTDLEYEENPDTQISFLARVTVTGYRKEDSEYIRTSMPPVTFRYSEFKPHEQRYQSVSARGNDMPALALSNPDYALVDLFGNGLPDVLHTAPTGFRYWQNLGGGTLDRPRSMPQVPAGVTLSQPGVSFADMAGDGRADLLVLDEPYQGFYETTPDGTWETFKRFNALPSLDLADPNLRLLDLTGDGLTDVLMTRDDHFLWFECLGEDGYAEPKSVERVRNLDKFPDVYFTDPSGRVRLADMTGDGLNDIVLIHDGRVDYWPNLGYGHFGERITMAESPRLEYNYDPARLFLVDLDGSGCADLVYVDFGQTHFWFNRSGNSWSNEQIIPGTPSVTNSAAIQFADFFGTGTIAAVWSYDYNQQLGGNYKVLDFCGGRKPYLLEEMDNNLGATTRVRYAPSTRFLLEDEANGQPWATKLPFPVHVVDKIEVIDHISKTKLITTYKYHHGYFDGREREFRGFGRVDQFDTEVFDKFSTADLHEVGVPFTNTDRAYHVPPVLTKTWFHTGIYYERLADGRYLNEDTLLERYRGEFYQDDPLAFELGSNLVPLNSDTPYEAFRALRGAILRTETYALDGTDRQVHPYQVAEKTHQVRQLQPKDGNNHGVYLTVPLETLTYHYERQPADPRIAHEIVLNVDKFGNVTDQVSIAYPRRRPARPQVDETGAPILDENDLPLPPFEEQRELKALYAYSRFINEPDEGDFYYVGVPFETRTFELHGLDWQWPDPGQAQVPLSRSEFSSLDNVDNFAPFSPDPPENMSGPVKRIVEWTRTYFRKDSAADDSYIDLDGEGCPIRDLTHRLNLGELDSLALPYETYQAALTDDLVQEIFDDEGTGTARVNSTMLCRAGYHEEDNYWWIPSGQQSFSESRFYLPIQVCDPFASKTTVAYDIYALLQTAVEDALQNRTEAENDYRVLQPGKVTDPNGNHSLAAFDALGLVVATAVQSGDGSQGDKLSGFQIDLDEQGVTDYMYAADPRALGPPLLGKAATRLVYDLWACQRARGQDASPAPVVVSTLVREIHDHELAADNPPPIQHSFLYSDGFGREVQTKIQAQPGPVPGRHTGGEQSEPENGEPGVPPKIDPRWVGTGSKIYNNKVKPVRQYEPFFSDSHQFEFAVQVGVSPTLFYDPLERVVCTLHPNHTYEKVIVDAWEQETWDVNDTVAEEDPANDPHVGAFFTGLNRSDYTPTWHTQRKDSGLGSAEQDAADKALAHADTPTVVHLDTSGRIFLTVEDDGTQAKVKTHVQLDIEGNDRVITDPRDIEAFEYTLDIAARKLLVHSVDAGKRLSLPDVNGQPSYVWDANGNEVYTNYDELHRPVDVWVRKMGTTDYYLAQKSLYGEATPASAVANHRGQVWKLYDGAGLVENVAYDFKGNLLEVGRTLLVDSKATEPAWARSADPVGQPTFDETAALGALDTTRSYAVKTAYDAQNRVTRNETPDSTIQEPRYNEANLLEKLTVTHADTAKDYVTNIDYNARGQRTCIQYGNGVTTEYDYDPETFRVTHIVSFRPGRSKDNPDLQDLKYTYDPIGNITRIHDDAHQIVFNHNSRIEPENRYTYDPLYRLVEATGREHQAMTVCHYHQGDKKQTEFITLPYQPASNGQALGNYAETYIYDKSGNLTRFHHRNRTFDQQRTRYQEYEPGSNRILWSQGKNQVQNQTTGQDEETLDCSFEDSPPSTRQIPHDNNGNIVKLPHLPQMGWDFKNQLVDVQLNVGSSRNRAYYQYDANGQRMRRTVVKNGRTEERVYLGGYEIYTVSNGSGPTLRRDTIHVMDDQERIASIEVERDPYTPANIRDTHIRYQFSNHLGSAMLEVGGSQSARIISYEEYYPYGGTAYLAGRNETEAKRKRYRYSGKERDDETGLYYYGVRFYVPWLGRWMSPDPAGLIDGVDLFIYTRNNPILLRDSSGNQTENDEKFVPHSGLTGQETVEERAEYLRQGGIEVDLSKPHEWNWNEEEKTWEFKGSHKITGDIAGQSQSDAGQSKGALPATTPDSPASESPSELDRSFVKGFLGGLAGGLVAGFFIGAMIASGGTLALVGGFLAVVGSLFGGLTLGQVLTGENLWGKRLTGEQRAEMGGELLGALVGSGLGWRAGTRFRGWMATRTGVPKARVPLNEGQQGKHIPGHNNYIPGRSPLTHPDPQGLLDGFAGRGQPVNNVPRGQPGFRERVDFRQVIGEYNGQPTTKGIIHYSKNGAKIVPAKP